METEEKTLPDYTDVIRAVGEMAFGNANDCVKLVTQKNPLVNKLNLKLLAEIKKSDKGAIGIRLVDRISALRLLAELLEGKTANAQATMDAIAAEF